MIHANFSAGALHLWAEDADAFAARPHASTNVDAGSMAAPATEAASGGATDDASQSKPDPADASQHPFAAVPPVSDLGHAALRDASRSTLNVQLPARSSSSGYAALPSSTLSRSLGLPPDDEPGIVLAPFTVPCLVIKPEHTVSTLTFLDDLLARESADADLGHASSHGALAGASLRFFAMLGAFSRHLLAQQRFIPGLVQSPTGELKGQWQAWVSDSANAQRTATLVSAMPASARAAIDGLRHDPWSITESFLSAVVDAQCRATLIRETFGDSISERDPGQDAHVAWLSGLLNAGDDVLGPPMIRQELVRRVRTWVGVLEERGASSVWRLLIRLAEPVAPIPPKPGAKSKAAPVPDSDDPSWPMTFHLQSVESPTLVLDATDIWQLSGDSVTIMGRRLDRPQELLLGELGRASRFVRRLEEALESGKPEGLSLNTKHAYEFLREQRPVLLEQGFGVDAPAWWDSPSARLGARLRLEAEGADPFSQQDGGMTNAARTQLGLGSIVNYTWEIAVGDTTLSLQEFEQLAAKRTPLVRINGKWVEIRPEDVHAAVRFIREHPGGKVPLGQAMRMAYGIESQDSGMQILGLEARGWLNAFLNSEAGSKALTPLEPPKTFRGTLRPYQGRGLSWMVFQQNLGFGVCLADDMGLGKTVQLLALLAWERETSATPLSFESPARAESAGSPALPPATQPPAVVPTSPAPASPTPAPSDAAPEIVEVASSPALVPPTLLLVPMSVVGNWMHETRRFCPHLKLLVHHGISRALGDSFVEKASSSDLVVTTYALAHRDRDLLKQVKWHRVVLDEAQYIKNPSAKQSQAVRDLEATCRVALTGTPVENRLTELWSIMDFLNPGYLGTPGNFRTRFGVPIERYHDKQRAEQLRGLIRPFILRRLKSDPTVVADLPEKVESREFSHLTSEQASLYESCVRRMLQEVDEAEGMQRRGLVLSALVRLKQICNHPSMLLKDSELSIRPPDPARSGKCQRLLEMLDEIIAEGDQSLVFTQFREMGTLLEAMIRHRFNKDVLFIHGGTTQPQRQAIIDRFQKADGTAPILLLSLRAGGVGLNLTAATHVFHFDRWWNPAVENQATDRAYRIGQTRTVQVHKFVVQGTLEERIDQMIESKTELAENIIGSGENWLTELNTDQLRDILTLRNDAVDDEP